MSYTWQATAAFGLEGLVLRELQALGLRDARTLDMGGVTFTATPEQAFEANLWLRTADRILLTMGRFEALSFDALYESVRALPWERVLPRTAAFPIRAHCARSQLMSPSDCQSIVKKAIASRLMSHYREDWCPENGAIFAVDVAIHRDQVHISLDASGDALNKRGYRALNGTAALRETLAAALVTLSGWRPGIAFCDPCCGTGTLPIEAAFRALNRAPGLTREFAMERWPLLSHDAAARSRAQARERFETACAGPSLELRASDIDAQAISYCRHHIASAGVQKHIVLEQRDLRDVRMAAPNGTFLLNPPYGERMGDRTEAQAVARALRGLYDQHPGYSLCALTGDLQFERAFRMRARTRRRLYNGRIECEFLRFDPRGAL